MKIYKIQRKSDGLFSRGGSWPTFSSKGKVWNGIGPLKNHLNQLVNYGKDRYADCEVLEIEINEKCLERTPVSELSDEIREIKEEKKRSREAVLAERRKQNDIKELKRLQEKYPDA